MSQQLKVGQVWKDREGNEVTITSQNDGPDYPFDGSNRESYTEDRKVWRGLGDDPCDLIELIRDVPDSDGWITWNGGECPVAGDTRVDFRLRDGRTYLHIRGKNIDWFHDGQDYNVVAYRVCEHPAESEQPVPNSEGWITWNGGECPVSGDARVDVKFRSGRLTVLETAGYWLWDHDGNPGDIIAYRVVEHPAKTEQPATNPKHAHYFKSVAHLDTVDVYRVCELFGVTDQAIGHAIKKLLCAGQRGVKDQRKDVQEAIDTLTRRVAMWQEDEVAK